MSTEDAREAVARKQSLRIATFNTLDFFLPAKRHRAVFEEKLTWTVAAIAECDADVVALQEIGEAEALEKLVTKLRERDASLAYTSVVGSPDKRGIRCALLTRLPLLDSKLRTTEQLPFPIFEEGDIFPFPSRLPLRRAIVHATIDTHLGPVHFLVVHFKSGRPVSFRQLGGREVPWRTARAKGEAELRALVLRSAESLYVRGLVDEILNTDAAAHIVVLGDFNDTLESTPVRLMRGMGMRGELHPASAMTSEERRFTVFHHGAGTQIDHILLGEPLRARQKSCTILNEHLRDHDLTDAPDDRPSVDSDHAPVVVEIV